jgi:uncharacterized protein (TIGR02246 family)
MASQAVQSIQPKYAVNGASAPKGRWIQQDRCRRRTRHDCCTLPMTMNPRRPTLNVEHAMEEASKAVAQLIAELQAGWDRRDAEITDRRLAADVVWGSPFGATVHGYDQLHAIHAKLKEQGKGGAASRFEVERVAALAPDVVVAQIRRLALERDGQPVAPGSDASGAFSETALYVLVRREGTWWIAAGHNTPIRPGGAA